MFTIDSHLKEAAVNSIVKENYELSEDGILVPDQKAIFKNYFWASVNKGQREYFKNIVTTEGMNKILDVMFGGNGTNNTQITTWYIGIYTGTYTPVITETAANVATSTTETQAYSSATRPAFVEATAASSATSNSGNEAAFVATGSITVKGAFVISSSDKTAAGDATAKLWSVANLGTSKALVSTEQLDIGYSITLANA